MHEPLKFTVSKGPTTNVFSILFALGITGYIFFGVSVFSNNNSFEAAASAMFWIGTFFIVIAVYIYITGKQELFLTKNTAGEIEFELKSPFHRNAYMIEVYTGAKGPARKVPELYLIFLDKLNNPLLTLKTNPGLLADIPKEFIHVDIGSFEIKNVYTCSKIREFSFMLTKRESQ